jgi:hypothetical protein
MVFQEDVNFSTIPGVFQEGQNLSTFQERENPDHFIYRTTVRLIYNRIMHTVIKHLLENIEYPFLLLRENTEAFPEYQDPRILYPGRCKEIYHKHNEKTCD